MTEGDREELKLEQRRREVGRLYRLRYTCREVAAKLGISPATVVRDLEWLRAEWRAERLRNTDEIVAEELAKLNELEAGLWQQATFGGKGQTFAVEQVLSIMERRARLLGLDAPTTINVTAELERFTKEMAARFGLEPEAAWIEARALVLE